MKEFIKAGGGSGGADRSRARTVTSTGRRARLASTACSRSRTPTQTYAGGRRTTWCGRGSWPARPRHPADHRSRRRARRPRLFGDRRSIRTRRRSASSRVTHRALTVGGRMITCPPDVNLPEQLPGGLRCSHRLNETESLRQRFMSAEHDVGGVLLQGHHRPSTSTPNGTPTSRRGAMPAVPTSSPSLRRRRSWTSSARDGGSTEAQPDHDPDSILTDHTGERP